MSYLDLSRRAVLKSANGNISGGHGLHDRPDYLPASPERHRYRTESPGRSTTPFPARWQGTRGVHSFGCLDVLFQAYFTAYLVLASIGAPLNPGNPLH